MRAALDASPGQAQALGRLAPRFAPLGALMMLASGLALLATRGCADWGHPWLTAKLTRPARPDSHLAPRRPGA